MILPSIKFDIITEKTPQEIASILKEETSEGGQFQGKVNETSFKICPRPKIARNSFLPIIIGNISETAEGRKINIKMRMMLFFCVFVLAWQIPLIFVFFSSFVSIIANGVTYDAVISCILSVIILTACQCLMRLCFYIPAKKAKKWLEQWLV